MIGFAEFCPRLHFTVFRQKLFVYGLELVVLLLGDKHRPAHDRFRAVPLRLHGQEILPGLLSSFVSLDHAELFGHWDGKLVINLVLTTVLFFASQI